MPPIPHTAPVRVIEPRGCGPFTFIPPFRSGGGTTPVRPGKHSAIKPAWLCFPSNAYCEKKRSGGTNCRGPTYANILGNEGCLLPWITQNRTTSSRCCRAWKALEGWRRRLAATPLTTYMSPPTLSGRVSSGRCFGDFGLTIRHRVKARPPCLITNC